MTREAGGNHRPGVPLVVAADGVILHGPRLGATEKEVVQAGIRIAQRGGLRIVFLYVDRHRIDSRRGDHVARKRSAEKTRRIRQIRTRCERIADQDQAPRGSQCAGEVASSLQWRGHTSSCS